MITNLLDKIVSFNDKTGKICAVYMNEGVLQVALVMEDDEIKTNVILALCKAINDHCWEVIVYWQPQQKIKTIKNVREHTGMGLKEAKEHVEAHLSGVPIKSGLTLAEAEEVKRSCIAEGLEATIRRMPRQ